MFTRKPTVFPSPGRPHLWPGPRWRERSGGLGLRASPTGGRVAALRSHTAAMAIKQMNASMTYAKICITGPRKYKHRQVESTQARSGPHLVPRPEKGAAFGLHKRVYPI